MNSDKLNDVILFSCIRKLKNATAQFLTTLEARIIYIRSLEQTLIKMGVGNYEESNIDFQRDRKFFLDELGKSVRELEEIQRLACENKVINNK